MNSRRMVILLLAALTAGLAGAGYLAWDVWRKDVVYIAVAGSLSGPNRAEGDSMLTGVRLALAQARAHGRLPDARIKLLLFDDGGDADRAAQVAERIVRDPRIAAVIGHITSGASLAAGRLYRKYEIPAITGTASAEDVTRNNDWYFRIVPNNAFQGVFIAHYIKNALGRQTAAIVTLNDPYSQSLSQAFQSAATQIGLNVQHEYTLTETGTSDQALAAIVSGLSGPDAPEAVFLAAYANDDTARVLTALRTAGNRVALIGAVAFSNAALINNLVAAQTHDPGMVADYTDGLYAISMFMKELAGKEGLDLLHAYRAEHPSEPLHWIVPCYYDAMNVAIEALTRAELQGPNSIRANRKQIREALASLYAPPDNLVHGALGDIYFDQNRDANRPLAMGVYANGALLPAFTQYQQLRDPDRVPDRIEAALNGDLLVADNQFLTRTQVVRASIQVHQVQPLDDEETRFRVDFSLRLRFARGLDAANIIFPTALAPIQVEAPIFEASEAGITTQIYRLQGEFSQATNYRRYPFDRQTLQIAFRHAERLFEDVIYVPDASGWPDADAPRLPAGWQWQRAEAYQSVAQHTVLQHVTPYSEFLFDLRGTRRDPALQFSTIGAFAGLSALIILVIVLPEHWLARRILTAMLALSGMIGLHALVAPGGRAAAMMDFEYAMLAGYGVIMLSVFGAVSHYTFYRARLAIIQRMPLFRPLSAAEKTALSKNMHRRRYRKSGRVLCRQGEPGASLFLIIDGDVAFRLTTPDHEEIEVNRLGAGCTFGELALLTGRRRTVSAVTATPARIGEIDRSHILPFIRKHPEMIRAMAAEMARLDLRHTGYDDPDTANHPDFEALCARFTTDITEFLGMTLESSDTGGTA